MSVAPQTICLTPTRNEGWIIDRFLAAASCWADHIIVADQLSTDGTVEQIQRAKRARLVINDSPVFNEPERQRLLIENARKIAGPRIFIALDADEALSANVMDSDEWRRIKEAKPGTILRFRWVNVLPGFEKVWIPSNRISCGFVDDGAEHVGRTIHSPRVPLPPNAPVIDIESVVVLHFQYVLWERMRRKQRWYQAFEHVTHRQKTPLQIFREYNHMYGSWDEQEIHPLKPEWLEGYERAGIDFESLQCETVTWWDKEILQMLREHGPEYFRRIAIWDENWDTMAARSGLNGKSLADPRSLFERLAHQLLKATQKNRSTLFVRSFERFLRLRGW